MKSAPYLFLTILLAAMLLLTAGTSRAASTYTVENMRTLGLPVINITTTSGATPRMQLVESPTGTKKPVAVNIEPARMVMMVGADTIYDSGVYEKGVSGITIKGNGNSSSRSANYMYKLKLQKAYDLLERGEKKYADHHWRLMKDAQTMRSMLALALCKRMGVQWVQGYRPCVVFVNNTYRGIYLIMENVRRKPGQRLDVDKDGYIIERDAYYWYEQLSFISDYLDDVWQKHISSMPYGYTFRYPKWDKITNEEVDWIHQRVNLMEKHLMAGHYEDDIDVESFATWLLIHDILGTQDSGGSNIFLTLKNKQPGTRFKMGNLWDFDSCLNVTTTEFAKVHNKESFYFGILTTSSNKAFIRAYKKKWREVREGLLEFLCDFQNNYAQSEEGQSLSQARTLYNSYWRMSWLTIDKEAETNIAWLTEHLAWLDKAIEALDDSDPIMGDANHDGAVTVADLTLIANYILGHKATDIDLYLADTNGDGEITVADLTIVASTILNN